MPHYGQRAFSMLMPPGSVIGLTAGQSDQAQRDRKAKKSRVPWLKKAFKLPKSLRSITNLKNKLLGRSKKDDEAISHPYMDPRPGKLESHTPSPPSPSPRPLTANASSCVPTPHDPIPNPFDTASLRSISPLRLPTPLGDSGDSPSNFVTTHPFQATDASVFSVAFFQTTPSNPSLTSFPFLHRCNSISSADATFGPATATTCQIHRHCLQMGEAECLFSPRSRDEEGIPLRTGEHRRRRRIERTSTPTAFMVLRDGERLVPG